VIIHAHYLEILEELLLHVQYLPAFFDLYLNFSYIDKSNRRYIDSLKKSLKKTIPGQCIFTVSQNRGQDVGGFFASTEAAKSLNLSYDYVCKIHTKSSDSYFVVTNNRTGQLERQYGWREDFLDTLLGSSNKVLNHLQCFETYPSIGLISSRKYYTQCKTNFNANINLNNYLWLKNKLKLKAPHCYPNNYAFLAGTMFWMRGEVWDYIKECDIKVEDFEIGAYPDGLRAHAFERVFDPLLKHMNYSCYLV
jgi:lipopolysaccharide biosynthesis protein